jgi:hypothetical protein
MATDPRRIARLLALQKDRATLLKQVADLEPEATLLAREAGDTGGAPARSV